MSSDLKWMRAAIRLAGRSKRQHRSDPLAGAVLVKNGRRVANAFRGELRGATLYSTLEPCTRSDHDTIPRAQWVIDRQLTRVVIGVLDPNPAYCGQGYWRLRDAGVTVDFFPGRLADQIVRQNQTFIREQRGPLVLSDRLAAFIHGLKAPGIAPFDGLGVGSTLSLQDHPDLRQGWPVSRVQLSLARAPFRLVPPLPDRYKAFFKRNYEKYRFKDDGSKYTVTLNPTAFSDSPSLSIDLARTTYSQSIFFRKEIAPVPALRGPLIREAVTGSLAIRFASAFSLHAAIVTSDSKLLRTRRSGKVAYHPHDWSVSVEEQLAPQDLGPERHCGPWARRLLSEELGLGESACHIDQFRIQSVFLEADVLSVALCGIARLNVSSSDLNTILRGRPRSDHEFTEWDFIDLSAASLLQELRTPSRAYHPTSGYRLLHVLLKECGPPSDAALERLFQSPIRGR